MVKAAQGGLGEVTLGKLAQTHGGGSGAKGFGQRMVRDHTQANARLKRVAGREGVRLSSAPGPEEQAARARLARLSGPAFDRAYLADMVEDHEKDVAEFQKEAATGKDPAARAFAAQTLPTLRMHLQMARSLSGARTK
jgi:putative membrane protein